MRLIGFCNILTNATARVLEEIGFGRPDRATATIGGTASRLSIRTDQTLYENFRARRSDPGIHSDPGNHRDLSEPASIATAAMQAF